MVRFMLKSPLDQLLTCGPTVCTAEGTYSLALVGCSLESVIETPVMPTKGLKPICIVGGSLIFLGLTHA